ncbi:hypothetical protein MB818_11720 [Ruegeria sp. 1NDH52C]|uniref:DUF4239 domain-containing protein n=1 Tax=Ruegeria alba TaxID=2916756 RepID=A0ABS9NXG6_9RHOB|nr:MULTISPECIES: hypothetical protein [Ruegeria]MCE8510883.1 hypothetical protein [Ruegeria pomeroyi]MCG6558874.1 hypothetical protein [Ruegeria alba]
MQTLFQLPVPVAAFVFVAATLVLALSAYGLTRAILCRSGEAKSDLAGPIFTRVGALHALILALVFAQELINVRDISTASAREAVLVGDAFYDLKRYDPEETLPIRKDLAGYVRLVLEQEWDSLAEADILSPEAWAAWERAYVGALELEPATDRQNVLKGIVVDHLREVSGLRRLRENAAIANVQDLFMMAAVAGLVLTSAGLFTHAPNTHNIFLLSIFAAYTGLIVFFVVAFANPYHAPGMVMPTGFENLFMGELAELGR